jgi:hypothetical protein
METMATGKKKQAVLEHLRTGAFGPTIEEELRAGSWTSSKLFLNASNPRLWESTPRAAKDINWKHVYQWLVRIGSKYGLTLDEFEAYCTIPAPTPSKGKGV